MKIVMTGGGRSTGAFVKSYLANECMHEVWSVGDQDTDDIKTNLILLSGVEKAKDLIR